MEECNTGITITQTAEECAGNYLSTNCVATPNAITYLDISAGASQTQINANIVSALMRKDEQISEIPIANGSETKIVAGANVTVTGTGTNLSNYVISATGGSSGERIFTYTTSGDEVTPIFIFPHGLSYTPTMVLATGNTMDTLSFFDGFVHYPLLFFAFADSTNIIISYQNYDYYPKAPKIGVNNLKWTVLCK
jgi:hypothetical protein